MNLKQKNQYFQCISRAEVGDIFEIQGFWNGATYIGTMVGTTNISFLIPVVKCQNHYSPTKIQQCKYPILKHIEFYFGNPFLVMETDRSIIRIIKKPKDIG